MADQSLHLLIELTAKARDIAARALAQSRTAEQLVINQLRTLDQYQQEYRQNLQLELAKDGMSPSALTNYRGFLQSLEEAVERAQKAWSATANRWRTTRSPGWRSGARSTRLKRC